MLEQMPPRLAANDIADGWLCNAIFNGKITMAKTGVICTNFLNHVSGEFGLVVFFAYRYATAIFSIGVVLEGCPFKQMVWINTGANVTSVASLRRRPVTVREKKGQSVYPYHLAVIATVAIPVFWVNRERPNQAGIRVVVCNCNFQPAAMCSLFPRLRDFFPSICEDDELGLGARRAPSFLSAFCECFKLRLSWDMLQVWHFRSLTATVLGWVRFSERPSFSIIQVTT